MQSERANRVFCFGGGKALRTLRQSGFGQLSEQLERPLTPRSVQQSTANYVDVLPLLKFPAGALKQEETPHLEGEHAAELEPGFEAHTAGLARQILQSFQHLHRTLAPVQLVGPDSTHVTDG